MRIVCGLDVHKDSIYFCILSSMGEIIEKVFGVLTLELYEICEVVPKNGRFSYFGGNLFQVL